MSTAIDVDRLGKRYGETWAVRDCSLVVPAGAICALVGANGAGKTTLLRVCAGAARATEGSVRVSGRAPADDAEFLRAVGYVAQDMPLHGRWTVADHLAFGAHLNRVWDDDGTRARLVERDIPLDRRVADLSGGMRAQLALTLALGKCPEVLLLDEPLAALDPVARRRFMATLAAAVAERALTVVLSSHLLPDLERVCDHLVVLAGGHTVLSGDVDAIVREHTLVRGPRLAAEAIARQHTVVTATTGRRDAALVVRRHGPMLDPAWQVEPLSLEDIVLAYLDPAADGVEGAA